MTNAITRNSVAGRASAADLGQQLVRAARRGDLQTVQQLLENGVEPDSQDTTTATALHCAGFAGNHRLASTLLHAHANPNIQNKQGATALILAVSGPYCETGYLQCSQLNAQATVEILILGKTDVLLKDAQGHTALWHARGRAAEPIDQRRPLPVAERRRREELEEIIELLETKERQSITAQ